MIQTFVLYDRIDYMMRFAVAKVFTSSPQIETDVAWLLINPTRFACLTTQPQFRHLEVQIPWPLSSSSSAPVKVAGIRKRAKLFLGFLLLRARGGLHMTLSHSLHTSHAAACSCSTTREFLFQSSSISLESPGTMIVDCESREGAVPGTRWQVLISSAVPVSAAKLLRRETRFT